MPTYDYFCKDCGFEFEEFQSIGSEPLKECPKCGKRSLKRLITGGAGLIFKGSGFYITDYARKSRSGNGNGAGNGSKDGVEKGKAEKTKEA